MGKKRNVLYYLIIMICFLYFLLFPSVCLAAAADGLELWYKAIVPTLFPFMIISHFFVSTDMISTLLTPFRKYLLRRNLSEYGLFSVTVGLLCGFPMGMKILSDLYQENLISKEECRILGPFINQVSPGFIIVYTAEKHFYNNRLAIPMMCILYGSTLFYQILFRERTKETLNDSKQILKLKKTITGHEIINILDQSIIKAMDQLIHICGYIILFSILSSTLSFIVLPDTVKSFLTAVLEISNGIHKISLLNISQIWKIRMTVVSIAFGGICSAMQSYVYMSEFGLTLKKYIKTKAMIALIALLFSFIYFH